MRSLRKLKSIFHGASRSTDNKMGDARVASRAPAVTTLFNDPMRSEVERLESFKCKIPIPSDTEHRLAAKGFFYNESIKKVQCFACGTRFDYPLNFAVRTLDDQHKNSSPDCEFLRSDTKAGNIPAPPTPPRPLVPRSNEARMQDNRSDNSPNGNQTPLQGPEWNLRRNDSRPVYTRSAEDYVLLKSEYERLKTFMGVPAWPVAFISPADCAEAGFFFVGDADKVQCAFCRGVAGEWEEGDIPRIEHRRHFPRCPFVCGLPVGNIPLRNENENEPALEEDQAPGIDICGPFSPEAMAGLTLVQPGPSAPSGAQPFSSNLRDVAADLKIKPFLGPTNQQMITQQARLKSFKNWPQSLGQNVEVMAEAGFYYTGTADQVKCFYCNGGLKNWVATDDPWTEHAKWFPFCTHVVLNKGDEFVKNAAGESTQNQNGHSSDEDETAVNMETGSVKSSLSAASSSGVESSSSAAGSDRGTSPISDIASSGCSSGDEDMESTKQPEASTSSASKAPMKEEDKSRLECKICMSDDVGVAFLPCGHLVSCTTCATTSSNCALCRQPILGIVRVYQS